MIRTADYSRIKVAISLFWRGTRRNFKRVFYSGRQFLPIVFEGTQ
jgi:hypothetical protein